MSELSLNFPLFALRDAPNEGLVMVFRREPKPPILPLFSDPQWAVDFARRHSSPMVPSVPLFPLQLRELLTITRWSTSMPSHFVIDLMDIDDMRRPPGVTPISTEPFLN